MITVVDYLMGRDARFASACDATIRANAAETVRRTNQLKELAVRDGIVFPKDEVASGWRPNGVNDATCNAAAHSAHITAEALDTRDPQRFFARWCLRNLAALEKIGLWMEDPRWTPSWVHLQTHAPKSGRRVFIPSMAKPLAAALPEQKTLGVA